jgi:hypothetical protein
MAGKKISELPAAGALDGNELVEVVKGGVNSQTTAQDIADLGGGGDLDSKADALITPVSESGSYTLQSSVLTLINQGASIIVTGDDTGDLTVPPNGTVAFPVGSVIGLRGYENVVEGLGVTVTPTSGTLAISLGSTAYLEKTGTNTWVLHNGTAETNGWATSGITDITDDVQIAADDSGHSLQFTNFASYYFGIGGGSLTELLLNGGELSGTIDGNLNLKVGTFSITDAVVVTFDLGGPNVQFLEEDGNIAFKIEDLKGGSADNVLYYDPDTDEVTFAEAPSGGGEVDPVALTDGSSIELTDSLHTLTTDEAAITFTISHAGNDITIEVTLNATTATYTFPSGTLCVSEGVASGDNTLGLSGVSGDKYIVSIKKVGSNYYVVAKNFGQ